MIVSRRPRYFICHLANEDRAPNYMRQKILLPISIELDAPEGGLSGRRTYIDFDTNEVIIEGHRVPDKVVDAAKNLPVGDGGWFDNEGSQAGFF
jgi:phosphatidylserine/phosphatidylglycerophosphate/cardiolipin synthase-like enzyme